MRPSEGRRDVAVARHSGGGAMTRRHATPLEGPDVRASRLALARLCELRQAAAHAVRAAVRAGRRRARVVPRAGHVVARSAGSCSPSPARASRRWDSIASSTARSTRAIRARGSARFRAACLRVAEAVDGRERSRRRCSCSRRGSSIRSARCCRPSRWRGCSSTATPSGSRAGATSCSASACRSRRSAATSR